MPCLRPCLISDGAAALEGKMMMMMMMMMEGGWALERADKATEGTGKKRGGGAEGTAAQGVPPS